jgi:hypothetical protein
MSKIRSGMAVIPVLFASMLVVETSTAQQAPNQGTICQGNDIYVVCVDGTNDVGRYTARTGPAHPVPGRNVLFEGEQSDPNTSFSSYRSFTSGTTYTQGLVGDGIDLSEFATTTLIGTTGIRTTYSITEDANLEIVDNLEIVQDVNINGTTYQDSNIEVTTTITNRSSTEVRVGIRYLWDYQIGRDDGPTFQKRSPSEPKRVTEAEFAPPGFVFYAMEDNDFNDPTSPLYTVLGTANGPSWVVPAPTPATQITYGCWDDAATSAFDYSIEPGRGVATASAACSPERGGDSATLYWWGRSEANAITLAPAASVTKRALLFVTERGKPPPFDVTPPSCEVVSRTGGRMTVRLQDTQSGLKSIDVTAVDNIERIRPGDVRFSTPTHDPIDETATKSRRNRQATWRLVATDDAGNSSRCTGSGRLVF